MFEGRQGEGEEEEEEQGVNNNNNNNNNNNKNLKIVFPTLETCSVCLAQTSNPMTPTPTPQRMTRAREDIRLLDNPDGDGNADCPFEPTFATAGDDGLAPPALSRLRLADELDTYIDRVQVRVVFHNL